MGNVLKMSVIKQAQDLINRLYEQVRHYFQKRGVLDSNKLKSQIYPYHLSNSITLKINFILDTLSLSLSSFVFSLTFVARILHWRYSYGKLRLSFQPPVQHNANCMAKQLQTFLRASYIRLPLDALSINTAYVAQLKNKTKSRSSHLEAEINISTPASDSGQICGQNFKAELYVKKKKKSFK